MGRILAIGEGEVLDGLELCGVEVISTPLVAGAEAGLEPLDDDVVVLILTPAAASAVRDRLKARGLLHVVVPA